MKKIKLEKFSEKTLEIYGRFKEQLGSEHIATPITIEILLDICRNQKPVSILELGGGLGTISYLLLSNSNAQLDIYEDNDFCRRKLKENLATFAGRYQIIESYRTLPPNNSYDLVVVDGGSGKPGDGGYKNAVSCIMACLDSVKTIFVEGYRYHQCYLIRKAVAVNHLFKLSLYLPSQFKGQVIKGGSKIECKLSHKKLFKFINHIYWELIARHHIKNLTN